MTDGSKPIDLAGVTLPKMLDPDKVAEKQMRDEVDCTFTDLTKMPSYVILQEAKVDPSE